MSVSYETSSKVTRQVSKTSVSYETSSKSHTSSPQNERFVRDFLKNSHVNCPQNERFARDFLQKSSGNTHRSTHITQPCQAVSRFQPLQTTRQSQCDSDIPQLTQPPDSLRLPRIFPPSTRLTRAKYCACHEMSPPSHLATSRFPAPATRIALPHLKSRTKSCACHEK